MVRDENAEMDTRGAWRVAKKDLQNKKMTSIVEKMWVDRLRRFGRVVRRDDSEFVRGVRQMNAERKRGRNGQLEFRRRYGDG